MSNLDAIYSAIDDDNDFGNLAAAVAGFCGTRSASLTRLDNAGRVELGQMNYWHEADCAACFHYFLDDDPWRRVMMQHASKGQAFATDSVLSPQRFQATAMHNELFKVIGDDTARCAGIMVDRDGGTLNIGIHRAAQDSAFGAEDVARLDEVAVHVGRVLHARGVLGAATNLVRLMSDMLDSSGQAVVLVDSHRRIRHMTPGAKAVLDRRDGMRCRNGMVSLDDPAASQRLRAAIAGAIARVPDAPDALLCPRQSGESSHRLVVLPAGASSQDGAILLIADAARTLVSDDRLRRFAGIYDLTVAETALVAALADGLRLIEIADRRRVTLETIRTQLKRLFVKTGTSRQMELVRSLMLLPGP